MRKAFKNLIGLLALLAVAGCNPEPEVKGSKRWVVGQRITLQRQHGGAFVPNNFTFTDSAGTSYSSADPRLQYDFIDDTEIRFTVPHGVAVGLATVAVGATEGGDYVFNARIVRLFGVKDDSGTLTFYSLEEPDVEYASYQVSAGPGHVTLSAEGDRLIVVGATGEIHFLEVTWTALEPYAPSVTLGASLGRGVLMEYGALVAGGEGVGYIVKQPNGELELDTWLDTGPVSTLAAAPPFQAIAAGVSDDGTGTNRIFRIDASYSPPDLREPDGIDIGGTPNGVTDVAMSPDGLLAIAVNGEDNSLTDFINSADFPSPSTQALPAGDEGAWRLVVDAASEWLAVLCETSKTVAVYSVSGSGLTHSLSFLADPRVPTSDLAQAPVDAGFAPRGKLYVLLADGAISQVDLSASVPNPSLLRSEQPNAGTALLIQP